MSEHIEFTISFKRRVWTFLPLLSALYCLVISNEVVEGPLPAVVYAPVNGTAIFNCTYTGDNFDSEDLWFWMLGDTQLNEIDDSSDVSGGGEISILRVKVPQQLEPIKVTCELNRREKKLYYIIAEGSVIAEIKPYGEFLLTSTLVEW